MKMGWLPAGQVADRCRSKALSVEELMFQLLPIAAEYAFTQISGFQVGAVCQGVSGNLYCGANFEFQHLPFSATIHAEQAAIAHAFAHKESGVVSIAVTAPPCGHCRQFLMELNTAPDLKILLPDRDPLSLVQLLPNAFGPGDLDINRRLFSPPSHDLKLDGVDSDPLVEEALKAAQRSHTPYSGNCAGLAIEIDAGDLFNGSALESAAYNPTLPPLQAALVSLFMAGKKTQEISRVVLVESRGARVSYQTSTREMLATISKAELVVFLSSRA